jgi:hypothetical protein
MEDRRNRPPSRVIAEIGGPITRDDGDHGAMSAIPLYNLFDFPLRRRGAMQ